MPGQEPKRPIWPQGCAQSTVGAFDVQRKLCLGPIRILQGKKKVAIVNEKIDVKATPKKVARVS